MIERMPSVSRKRERTTAEAASVSYAVACAAMEKALGDDKLLREIEASPSELLESRQRIERAKRALADARAAMIQRAWADGTLTEEHNLGAAVIALFAEAPV